MTLPRQRSARTGRASQAAETSAAWRQDSDSIRVVLASGEHLVRGALCTLLRDEADVRVVAEAADADDLQAQVLVIHPTVAVVDAELPGLAGVRGLGRLRRRCPSTRVLAIVAPRRPFDVAGAVESDVDGILRTTAAPESFALAIRRVSHGEPFIDHDLAAAALRPRECPLTPRELAVLELVASGLSLAEVATRLHLSAGTVRNYVSAVLTKSGARNRVDAVRIAYDRAWLAPVTLDPWR